ncbi:helix-turn-helix domain-containing protein [Streptomyces sp. S186]|uniref:helix-turn-helix domain-containing protein n=1 Tax=Streptomyces sp. S186 TaxID=3434395 RepID=UPI003F67235D
MAARLPYAEIARRLGRSKSTIVRESRATAEPARIRPAVHPGPLPGSFYLGSSTPTRRRPPWP